MSFFNVTEQAIKDKLYNKVKQNLSAKGITNYNIAGIFRAFIEITGYFFYLLYRILEIIFSNVFASTAIDAWLDAKCEDVDIRRKKATSSTGVFVFGRNIAESTNIKIEKGKIIKTQMTLIGKQYIFYVNVETILPEDVAEVDVPVVSAGTGVEQNIAPGTILNLVNPIDGIDYVEVRNGWITIPAQDKETNDSLRERYYSVWKSETEGNKYYYQRLALEIDGVKDAITIPTYRGAGTLDVVITSNIAGEVPPELIANVQTHINEYRLFDGIDILVRGATTITHSFNIILFCYYLPEEESLFKETIRIAINNYKNNLKLNQDFIPSQFKTTLENEFNCLKDIVLSNENKITVGDGCQLALTVPSASNINIILDSEL